MRAVLKFTCVICSMSQLEIIEAYEDSWEELKEATPEQKSAIIATQDFSYQDLHEDRCVDVKQFTYHTTNYVCVEWSRIHYFYLLLD